MNQRWAEEIKQMNMSQFNQKAREMLKKADQQPREDCLYGIQLALWGISQCVLGDEADTMLVETVQAMTTWGPERLKNFFSVKRADGSDPDLPPGTDMENPSAVAKAILSEIEERIVLNFPWYYDVR